MIEKVNRQLVLAENQVIETKRLILRPITLADAGDMFEYASDKETTIYVFDTHSSIQSTREALATYFLSNPLGKYAMELKESGKMIGTIDIRIVEDHHKAEIGYTLNKNYWGKGFTTEAGKALIKLGFEELKLKRIEATHDIDNPASGRVMEKIGMKKEGVTPNYRFVKGRMASDAVYGMTDEDYRKSKEK